MSAIGAVLTRWALAHLAILMGLWLCPNPIAAAPIPARFPEGSIHGFLVLRTASGQFLAQGEIFEIVRADDIQKTTVFRFTDGSFYEERVIFTQQGFYELKSYTLEQRGPAFTEDTRISLERATGKYRVETNPHRGGPAKVFEGTMALPPDVYNGLIATVLRDLDKGGSETVHFVAFTPEPKLIQLEMSPAGEQAMTVGEAPTTAVHYVLKARLGMWRSLFAVLLRRVPKDAHAWIIGGDVPAFAGFEGQLYPTDPVWRIDLVSAVRK